MNNLIPKEILEIFEKVKKGGFEVYFVGGCVRDIILKTAVKDWDFATNATPEAILKLFPDAFYDNKFGTVGILAEIKKQKQIVEVTTYRSESEYKDRRHPEKVAWGKTIDEDLQRRDFTVNAISMDLIKGEPHFVDPYNGRDDLEKKIIRAVGNPSERFKEDALRLIRAIRFAVCLDFEIEGKTWEEIRKDSPLIIHISKERVRDELLKILASNKAYEGILLLDQSGLLTHILPELQIGKGVSMERPGRHHKGDVFTHGLLSLKFTPSIDPIVRFASLIHDVGKPKVEKKDEKGLVIFHNHELVGAKIAKDICENLRFSKKGRDRVVNLIRWHMFSVNEKDTDSAIRRFIRRVGVENVKDIIDLRIGDRLGGGTQTAESWRLKLFKKRVVEQLKPKPFSVEDMAVDGNDVMKVLSIKPSKKVGEILQKLFEEVDEDLSKNTREYLLKRIKNLK
ncbi:MAG: hypothetical protein A2W22_00130 [Candidatus Levybacteria bacterium RBG_16_35_11]|nr:MAG: hypothetical protein A2W22_00130 [Candidatus Levybacteria bacterium RBG_16_35_11]